MAKGKSLTDVLAEGDQIAHVWEANPAFSLGDATLAGLRQDLDDLRGLQGQSDALHMQLTQVVNDMGVKRQAINKVVVRARSGFRAVYGSDSAQYKQATATRVGERKLHATSTTVKKKTD